MLNHANQMQAEKLEKYVDWSV